MSWNSRTSVATSPTPSPAASAGIGILITDHNVRETLGCTDRAYIIHQGQILREGTAEELVSDEQVRAVYLGRNFETAGTGGVSSQEEHELLD